MGALAKYLACVALIALPAIGAASAQDQKASKEEKCRAYAAKMVAGDAPGIERKARAQDLFRSCMSKS